MTEKNEKNNYKFDAVDKPESFGLGHRHIQVLLVCIFISVAYSMRVNMSVAIVAMTDVQQNNSNIEIYNWNKKTKDVILSSFFWGYTIMQIPAGYLAERFGTKALFTVTLMANGIVSLLTPLAVHWGGWMGMCVCRAIQGITQSCVFPGTMAMASRWIPDQERSRLTNIMLSGVTMGTVAGMPLSSVLASTSYGWPSIFYVIGGLSISFGIIWIIFSANNPSSHKLISEDERIFIEKNVGFSKSEKSKKVPWKGILTSIPFLSIQMVQIGCVWLFNTILVEMPSYMNKILGINVRESGFYSALPFMGMWVISMIASVLSDWIINSKVCSKLNSRRIFSTLASWIPATIIIIMTYIPSQYPYMAIMCLVITVSFMGCMNVGFMLSYIDISPNYSGTILGISNCVSQALGIFAPIVVGFIVKEETNPEQWQIVFFITAVLAFVTNLIYTIFISADVQPWNSITKTDKSDIEKSKSKPSVSEEEMKMISYKENVIRS